MDEKTDVNGLGRPSGDGDEVAEVKRSDSKMEVVVDNHTHNPVTSEDKPQPPSTPKSPPQLKLETLNLPSDSDSDSSSSLSPVPSDTAIDLSVIRPPPAKKRKVGDSPPWKSAMTQTPTSFIENGRRKSGRVKELTAQQQKELDAAKAAANGSPKRRPKSSPEQVKKTYASPGRRAATTNGVNGSARRGRKRRSDSTPSPESTPSGKRATIESSESVEPAPPPPPRRKPGRPPAQKAPIVTTTIRRTIRRVKKKKGQLDEAKLRARAELIAEARRRKKKIPTFSSDEEDEYVEEIIEEEVPVTQDDYTFNYSSSDGDAEDDGNTRRPRIKLTMKGGPRIVTNHLHVLPKPKYGSFAEYINSREFADKPEDLDRSEEAAWEEADLRARIEEAGRTGVLAPGNRSTDLPEKQVEPARSKSHQDFLIEHALQMRRLMDKERRHLMAIAKKLATACAVRYWDRMPKTKEELEAEEEEANRKMYKDVVYGVKRKWAGITQEVEQRRIQRKIEEERLQGEKNLKKMLEQSSKLLARRVRGGTDEAMSGDGTSNEEDEEEDLDAEMDAQERGDDEGEESDEEDNDDMDDEDEEMFSSSGESEEDEPGAQDDDDSKLTVEELRAKYARLAEEAKAAASQDDEDTEMRDGSSAAPSDSESLPAHATRKSALSALLDGTDDDNSILDEDEDDESVIMDSELDEDEDDDEEEEEGSEEESGSEAGFGGLAGFYADLYGDVKGGEDEDEEEVEAEEEEKEEVTEVDVEEKGAEVLDVEEKNAGGSAPDVDTAESEDQPKAQDIENDETTPKINGDVEISDAPDTDATISVESVVDVAETSEPVAPLANGIHKDEDMEVEKPASEEPALAPEPEQISSKPVSTLEVPSESIAESEKMDIDTVPDREVQEKKAGEQAESENKEEVEEVVREDANPSDIKTPIPFLLRGKLREYQHYGLDWLAGLYENNTNGILADEMGLGKTIQTIALLSHLACEKEVWGPHLVVVPTSVILNWEMEFKKWAPGFKILTYYGSREERQQKRKGWLDNNLWHVCITSYQLVIQDATIFKRRNWHYLILDEAHNIKNFRSQRWQTLLNFKANARLLLTGTPLQNNLVELWSLLYFLMPSGVSSEMPTGFANLKEFQEWFARPVDQIIEHGRQELDEEAKHTVQKLHQVLRPYLLRRLKADVEKQMPAKYEHVVTCRLSKRQRFLYDEFMSLARTRETLASGNYLSIINCLMQLRKVCNHPDLFETRQIVTSFATNRSVAADYEIKDFLVRKRLLEDDEREKVNLDVINLLPVNKEKFGAYEAYEVSRLADHRSLLVDYDAKVKDVDFVLKPNLNTIRGNLQAAENKRKLGRLDTLKQCIYLNRHRADQHPIYGRDVIDLCTINTSPLAPPPKRPRHMSEWFLGFSDNLRAMIPTLEERSQSLALTIEKFSCVTPAAVSTDLPSLTLTPAIISEARRISFKTPYDPYHQSRVRLSIAFPDKRLLQYDCGKLQHLATLLRQLQAGGHRALIFTQMTKVLDILEQFLNIHGYRYLRLDGATRVEQRQILTDRFNNDPRILVFILSTRSGGLGINLTGADTVIFYDMDWNPAMDKQCQDRCHRIGQTRDVHIYRFVSEHTIESNILKKANQKRMLDDVVIQEGDFTTDYFTKLDIRDMLDGLPVAPPSPGSDSDEEGDEEGAENKVPEEGQENIPPPSDVIKDVEKRDLEKALEDAEDEEDAAAAKVAAKEIQNLDMDDFVEASSTAAATAAASAAKSKKAVPAVSSDVPTPQLVKSTLTSDAPTPLPDAQTPSAAPGAAAGEEEEAEEEEDGEEGEHIDEYMIRFMEWELADVPVVIPQKRDRDRKNNKKAKLRY